MVSSFVSALFVASVTARFAPRSAEPPMRLADRQTSNFATIKQADDGSIPRFDWEKTALSDSTIEQALSSVSADARSLFQFASHNVASDPVPETDSTFNGRECKVFPGDEDWPVEARWSALNDVTNGALMKPVPQAHVCYNNGTGDQDACEAMTKAWTDPFYQLDDPIEMLTPMYQGNTCQPPEYYDSEGCTQGGYSLYVVNASSTAQIQLALNFARNTGIRFVVRNTGHDFAGKSGGAGSLSVWTHHLKEIAFLENYKSSDYSGPAMKVGAGVQGFELYAAARDVGGIVMGGECPTVGVMGGWIQGGGHSPLSGHLGLGADHVLSLEVVTTDGRYVTADKENNSELFWSLRGGGGLTYGVVTSVTVKMHPDQPIASANWVVSTGKNVSTQAFKEGMKAYMKYFPQNADNNTYAYWKVFPSPDSIMMDMSPFFAPGKTVEEAKVLIDPWVKDMAALGITVEPEWTQYDGFYDAYNGSFPVEGVMSNGVAATSRMIPRNNWANDSIFDETFEGLWQAVDEGMALIGYNMAPSWEKGGRPDNSVNPAWRDMIGFIISGTLLNMTNSAEEIVEERLNMTNGVMQRWRELTPGSGSYLSEGDRLEPNFQWSFFGSYYPRLLEAKRKYDPFNLFWASGAVGSEFFDVRSFDGLPNENGRLCVNPEPKLYEAEGPDWVPQ